MATKEETWIEIREIVETCKTDQIIATICNDWSSISEEDRKKFHLDIPIEKLSLGGCTPEGLLKKTIGMSRKDLPKMEKI
jgi:hypothetical protein